MILEQLRQQAPLANAIITGVQKVHIVFKPASLAHFSFRSVIHFDLLFLCGFRLFLQTMEDFVMSELAKAGPSVEARQRALAKFFPLERSVPRASQRGLLDAHLEPREIATLLHDAIDSAASQAIARFEKLSALLANLVSGQF